MQVRSKKFEDVCERRVFLKGMGSPHGLRINKKLKKYRDGPQSDNGEIVWGLWILYQDVTF